MILQTKVPIAPTDTYDSLHDRLAQLAGPFTLETLDLIEKGELHPIPQEHTDATPAPKIQPADARIDFDQPSKRVADFIRGMATRPGAFTFFRGQKLKAHFARPADHGSNQSAAPGTILLEKKALLVRCRESVVELTRVVPAGRKEMDGVSFINGIRPQAGESFSRQGITE
jgi:methionyl-tRNA formyltransferase